MTGPEHYREAERLVELSTSEDDYILLLKAKVHATLALAAASAYPALKDYYGDEAHEDRAWAQVTA